MISLKRRPLRRVAWFVAGLLCTLLFAVPSLWQPATAISSSNRIETVKHSATNSELAAWRNPAFDEVAASHLEPNFYQ